LPDGAGYFVEDAGGGIDPAEVARLFSIARPLVSTKLLRLPTRGAPERSHRARLPFAGEIEPERSGPAPDGHQLLLLIRQVEPGRRIKVGFFIPSQILPVPDSEAIAHALFDIATARVPIPRNGAAMCALIEKYQDSREAN
jgi:hypothetical protein